MPETLILDPLIFQPSTISACFVNIADSNGEAFLESAKWFSEAVIKTILDIHVE